MKANRKPTDRRYYTYDQYLQFKGINTENDNRQIVIYTKVSTKNQKDDKNLKDDKNQKDDLHSQVSFLRQFCNARGLIIDQCILHVFSCRLYGLRKYKKQIEGDVEIAKELQDGNKSNQRTESENK